MDYGIIQNFRFHGVLSIDKCVRCTHTDLGTFGRYRISTCAYSKLTLIHCKNLNVTAVDQLSVNEPCTDQLHAFAYSHACLCLRYENRYRTGDCCICGTCHRTCQSLCSKISLVLTIHILGKIRRNIYVIFRFYCNRYIFTDDHECLIVIYGYCHTHCKGKSCHT